MNFRKIFISLSEVNKLRFRKFFVGISYFNFQSLTYEFVALN